jgi:hypothetical protein
VSPEQVVVIVDGVILSAILRVLTRYSANDPQFPVNDWSLFTGVPATGKIHVVGGASQPNEPAEGEGTRRTAQWVERSKGNRQPASIRGRTCRDWSCRRPQRRRSI